MNSSIPQALSTDQLDQAVRERAFPEMELIWDDFLALGLPVEKIDTKFLQSQRRKQMTPMVGGAWTLAISSIAVFAASLAYFRAVLTISNEWLLFAVALPAALNSVLLWIFAATLYARYVAFPLKAILAKDLAWMLSRHDFRQTIRHSDEGREFARRQAELGIGADWDNPDYRRRFELNNGEWSACESPSISQLAHQVLRDILGQKDQHTRKHIPGRLQNDLVEKKASIGKFLSQWQNEVNLARQGTLPAESAVAMLTSLRDEFIRADSQADRWLAEVVAAILRGDTLVGNLVEAEIWRRDPWVDLTHQDEFYSSASLRGVQWIGRGSKGRLGPFGYLRNPSISALDFRTKKGRIVRARLAAAQVSDQQDADVPTPVLYVDGVEGTNTVSPKVIRIAVESFARECGFSAVVYNRYVHNQVPRRFVRWLHRDGVPMQQVSLEFLSCNHREYLDGFGLPIEPFEYAHPRGNVVGHVVELGQSVGRSPTRLELTRQFLRRNSLWLLFAQAGITACGVTWWTSPAATIGLATFMALGAAGQVLHQRKSLRLAGTQTTG